MNIYLYLEEHTDALFDFILEFFGRDSDSAQVAWYFFMNRKINPSYQTQVYKILTRIAKIKYGAIKRKPIYNGQMYVKAISAVRKIIKWIQRFWMKLRHNQINLQSEILKEQAVKLLNSNKPLATEYAILFNLIETWKPFTGIVKKQVL